jgi:hypothetical protein
VSNEDREPCNDGATNHTDESLTKETPRYPTFPTPFTSVRAFQKRRSSVWQLNLCSSTMLEER